MSKSAQRVTLFVMSCPSDGIRNGNFQELHTKLGLLVSSALAGLQQEVCGPADLAAQGQSFRFPKVDRKDLTSQSIHGMCEALQDHIIWTDRFNELQASNLPYETPSEWP